MTRYIPPEVVEAGAKALAKGYNGGHTHHLLFMDEARATISAALDAWVSCGMAEECAEKTYLGLWRKALIIRTEAKNETE